MAMANMNNPEMSGESFENRENQESSGKLEELKQRVGKKTAMALLALNVGVTAGTSAETVKAEEPSKSEKSADALFGSVDVDEQINEQEKERSEKVKNFKNEIVIGNSSTKDREAGRDAKGEDNDRLDRIAEMMKKGSDYVQRHKDEYIDMVYSIKETTEKYPYMRSSEDEQDLMSLLKNEVTNMLSDSTQREVVQNLES